MSEDYVIDDALIDLLAGMMTGDDNDEPVGPDSGDKPAKCEDAGCDAKKATLAAKFG